MKIRVLHVSHSAAFSGAEQALFRVLSKTNRDRVESLVALPGDGPLRDALAGIGVRTEIVPIRWWIPATHWNPGEFANQIAGLEQRWQGLADLAAREKIDLLHSNTIVTIEGAFAAAALGIPHLWHSRGLFTGPFPPEYFGKLEPLFETIDELGDHVACVSNAVCDQTTKYLKTTPCTVIPDGFDPTPEIASRTSQRIVCIGGVQRRKGQMDLLNAFARLEHPEATLVFCGELGDADYVAQIKQRIEDLGLESRVTLAGFRNDIPALLEDCAVVVQPSHSEGFGLAVLEAMAAGKPVIATRCGGPEEMIEDGISGLLVPPESPAALAEALQRVLEDGELAKQIGDAGRIRAARFTVARSSGQFEDLLSRLSSATAMKCCDRDLAERVCARVLDRASTLRRNVS